MAKCQQSCSFNFDDVVDHLSAFEAPSLVVYARDGGEGVEDVDLDVPLGQRKQVWQDIAHPHEILDVSLEQHQDKKCVPRALAKLLGQSEQWVEGRLAGTKSSDVIEFCRHLGLGAKSVSYTHLTLPTNREV